MDSSTFLRMCARCGRVMILALVVASKVAHAGVAVDPIENSSSSSFIGIFTLGWTFTPTVNIEVTQLGYYDFDGDGLKNTHQVGIWNFGGSLLGSAFVNNSGSMIDGFRYVNAPTMLLLAGQNYVIGGFSENEIDKTLQETFGYSSFTTAPEIIYGKARWSIHELSFKRPDDSVFGAQGGVFGPNFQFETSTAAVPEPAGLLVWGGLGSLALVSLRIRTGRIFTLA